MFPDPSKYSVVSKIISYPTEIISREGFVGMTTFVSDLIEHG